jgi:hypothetical protein
VADDADEWFVRKGTSQINLDEKKAGLCWSSSRPLLRQIEFSLSSGFLLFERFVLATRYPFFEAFGVPHACTEAIRAL